MKAEKLYTAKFSSREITYQFIRSNRKTVAIHIDHEGTVSLRVPLYMSRSLAEKFLNDKEDWICNKLDQIQSIKRSEQEQLTDYSKHQKAALEKRYRQLARTAITNRVDFYLMQTGGYYEKITIRSQQTRWGSCSSSGTLSFNWRLILAPPTVMDYVIIHELCHLKYMNHSKEFWNHVEHFMPNYKVQRQWLKDHGDLLGNAYEPIPFSFH